eukprot:627244-Prorocentrum_lima.AAC.1
MTSSLVGSEMCIRDRRRARGVGDGAIGGCSGRRLHTYSWRWRTCRCKCCLLYTSDAADDM